VGGKREAAWLKSYLPDPKSQIPDAKMPKQTFTDKELEDLVEYMLSLK
jgi:cbb3-type cytochrome oxidase cytochrome c subunit